MVVGDVKKGIATVTTGAYLNIQPAAGEEWTIHNIFHAAEVELYVSNGTLTILFDSETQYGAWLRHAFDLANDFYLCVKNVNASSQVIAYCGKQTK